MALVGVAVVICLATAGVATWGLDPQRPDSATEPNVTTSSPVVSSAPAPIEPSLPVQVEVTVPDLPDPAVTTEPLATLSVDPTAASGPDPGPITGTTPAPATAPGTSAPASSPGRPIASSPAVVTPTVTAPTTAAAATTRSTAPPAAVVVPSAYAHVLGWIGGGKVVSLSFDDGPGPYTGRVLDVLKKYRIKATFCQIGEQVGSYPAVEARIKAEGHTFCNHSWDHDEALPAKPVPVIDSEISRTQQAISTLTGITPRYYGRPAATGGTAPG